MNPATWIHLKWSEPAFRAAMLHEYDHARAIMRLAGTVPHAVPDRILCARVPFFSIPLRKHLRVSRMALHLFTNKQAAEPHVECGHSPPRRRRVLLFASLPWRWSPLAPCACVRELCRLARAGRTATRSLLRQPTPQGRLDSRDDRAEIATSDRQGARTDCRKIG